MSTTKRRKAMGSDPLADAAPGAAATTDAPPEVAAPTAEVPPPQDPAGDSSPAPEAAPKPPVDDELPQPLDVHVPPAPPLRPVPRFGAIDPRDRLRTLTMALLMALGVALYAQHLNQLSEIEEAFRTAQGRLSEGDAALAAERARADRLTKIVAEGERQLEHAQLLLAEAEVSGQSLERALTELSRASASAAGQGKLAAALAAVNHDLGFAQRWPQERWPQLLVELQQGTSIRLGRRVRPEELSALRGEVQPGTLQALADASDALRPWRALGPDERLDPYPAIAERGLLLLFLLEAGMTVPDLTAIPFESASLRGHRLGAVDLRNVDLNRADLRGADLSAATLDGTILTGAVFDAATRWPPGFDFAGAGVVLAAAPVPAPAAGTTPE